MDGLPIFRIPPVTRTLLLLYGAVVLLLTMKIITPLQMVYSRTLVFEEKQYWRLITSFFFFGELQLNTALEIHWIYIVSSAIEEQYFHRRVLDYTAVVVSGGLMLLASRLCGVIDVMVFSSLLESVLMYLLSRLLPEQRVAFFAILEVPMRLLPALYSVIMLYSQGVSAVKLNLVCCFVGHCLWYALEIFPRITGLNPFRLQHHFDHLFEGAPDPGIVVN